MQGPRGRTAVRAVAAVWIASSLGLCVATRFGRTAVSAARAGTDAEDATPVARVVNLLEDMKAHIEAEAAKEDDAHENYVCWCTANNQEKTAAVTAAREEILRLQAVIEEAAGLEAQLKTEISDLKADIEADKKSVAEAVANRNKEEEAFLVEEKDAKDCVATLKEAITVLEKVQLLQRRAAATGMPVSSEESRPLLLQLKGAVQEMHDRIEVGGPGRAAQFGNVMQQDLWDVMGAINGAVTGGGFLAGRPAGGDLSALSVAHRAGEGQPNDLVGAAAGAKSYNSRSGQIFGILKTLREGFAKDLAGAQKQEFSALLEYLKLKAAKEQEIAAAAAQQEEKESALAEAQDRQAKAKQDVMATQEALSADEQFLLQLERSCGTNEEEHKQRVTARAEEVQAISETIKILTSEDARDLFVSTMTHDSFLQIARHSKAEAAAIDFQKMAVNDVMGKLLGVAHKHKDWAFASIAVRARLDSFTEVKRLMDKMLSELKAQQKADFEKRDLCVADLDTTEDNIKSKMHAKDDLEGSKLNLETTIAQLESDIETLNSQVANMQKEVKQAGEERHNENALFQKSVSDQRGVVEVLKKAIARMQQFYGSTAAASLAQSAARLAAPGQAVGQEPVREKGYEKQSGSASGALHLLSVISADASKMEAQLVADEQSAQQSYEALHRDMISSIQADEAATNEKTILLERARASKSETEGALLLNAEELENLGSMLQTTHLDCDFLMTHFAARRQARADEIGAIEEAQAILSGADFATS